MPKLPRVTPAELVRALARAGFVRDHQKGSHLTLRHLDGRRAIVPMHRRVLPTGTTHEILKQAGLSVEEFRGLLR